MEWRLDDILQRWLSLIHGHNGSSGEEKVGIGFAQILHRGDVCGYESSPKSAFVLQECVADGFMNAGHGAGLDCNFACPGLLEVCPPARLSLACENTFKTESSFDWRVLAS